MTLIKFFHVQFCNVLHQRVHLLFVLHELIDIDNILLLKVLKEVFELIQLLLHCGPIRLWLELIDV